MTISMYQASAPRFANTLKNLSAMLDKAQAHCDAKKIDPLVLTSARLYPDMFALARQVQVACDTAKGAMARLAGVEIPKHEDTEKTFEELKARIAKTVAFIETFKPAQIDGTEDKDSSSSSARAKCSGRACSTCSASRCPISTSTPRPPTTSCATTASSSSSGISSAIPSHTLLRTGRNLPPRPRVKDAWTRKEASHEARKTVSSRRQ